MISYLIIGLVLTGTVLTILWYTRPRPRCPECGSLQVGQVSKELPRLTKPCKLHRQLANLSVSVSIVDRTENEVGHQSSCRVPGSPQCFVLRKAGRTLREPPGEAARLPRLD